MAHITFPKPLPGEYLLERKTAKKKRTATEQKIMQEAKRLDGSKCPIPGCTYRDMPVDPCHVVHRGAGGNPKGDRTTKESVFAGCRIHHGMYDRGEIELTFLNPALGTRGPIAFSHFVNGTKLLMGVSHPGGSK